VGRYNDGRCAVAQRVHDEISDDALDRDRIHVDLEACRYLDPNGVGILSRGHRDDLLQLPAQRDAPRLDSRRRGIDSRKVEQLLDELSHPICLLEERHLDLGDDLCGELAAPFVQLSTEVVSDRKSTRLNSSHRTISY